MRKPRSPYQLETARLRLRPCCEADKPAFARILNTPRMMAGLGGVRAPEAIDALIDKRIADQAKHGHSYWAVELRETGELIGTAGIRIASNYPGTPIAGMHEIGWRIAEHHWGKGFAFEAAQASLAWAWANTQAPRIGAWTIVVNESSLRLMRKLGMTRRPDLDFDQATGHALVHVIERPA